MTVGNKWWRGAVIYQIYPRSFLDSNEDGIGDLKGIIRKLDYIASLGVDGIWISPFFTSPMKDFGYDVSDYRDVDPLFGELQDFKDLVEIAHELNLKVLIDQVMNHTSDQHPWFKESRSDRSNAKADWYVWADPKPDGSPPNNWLSIFGGSAWKWEARRHQYFLHNFLDSQADLNFHNPEVRKQVLEETEFWLQLGADGLRLDVVNFYFHDQQLRDNPPLPEGVDKSVNAPGDNPYTYQLHKYDVSQPENIAFLREIRALLDKYGAVSVGEIGDDHPLQTMSSYTSGNDKLHMAYTFDLLTEKSDVAYIKDVVKNLNNNIGDGWPCWALSNHDSVRAVTRWGKGIPPEQIAPVYLALLLSIRGSACIYQGEELGLPEADVPYDKLQDPYGITFWPEYKGRDGCRTPIPWVNSATHAGFSTTEPWLPIPEAHLQYACEGQEQSLISTLNRFRQFICWRKQFQALVQGEIEVLDSSSDSLLFLRCCTEQQILVAINLRDEAISLSKPEGIKIRVLEGHGFTGVLNGDTIQLNPHDAFYGEIETSS